MIGFHLLRAGLIGAALLGSGAALARHKPAPTDWRAVVTPDDRQRLHNWRQAWIDALAQVRASGSGAAAASDPLFDPDRALPEAAIPIGRYTCRITKLGATEPKMHGIAQDPPADCRVTDDAGILRIYKTGGQQRPVGHIYTDAPARLVVLGTMVFGDETKPLAYGQDQHRDIAGYIERIGPQRWRLVIPSPHFESLLDVVDLTPAGAQR